MNIHPQKSCGCDGRLPVGVHHNNCDAGAIALEGELMARCARLGCERPASGRFIENDDSGKDRAICRQHFDEARGVRTATVNRCEDCGDFCGDVCDL